MFISYPSSLIRAKLTDFYLTILVRIFDKHFYTLNRLDEVFRFKAELIKAVRIKDIVKNSSKSYYQCV